MKTRIGIVGCGAIGSRIAKSILNELKKDCQLTAILDINQTKMQNLQTALGLKKVIKRNLTDLIRSSDLVVEAVSANNTQLIIQKVLMAKKSVLAMSVGKLLKAEKLFKLAKKNKCFLLLPSGAIAGIDAIKAASLVNTKSITLTTRKPLSGFSQNSYLDKQGINLSQIHSETALFEGDVTQALKIFPQNINVAATIALACGDYNKLKIRIITSPKFNVNSHEIEMAGDFGRLFTKTENCVCPDNPKTSYLAVLSGIQTIKQFCTGVKIGT